jgi:hypothetical protein
MKRRVIDRRTIRTNLECCDGFLLPVSQLTSAVAGINRSSHKFFDVVSFRLRVNLVGRDSSAGRLIEPIAPIPNEIFLHLGSFSRIYFARVHLGELSLNFLVELLAINTSMCCTYCTQEQFKS